jgi:hypothetical protein
MTRNVSQLHLSQAQIETLQLATQTDGWARTYRAAGLQETTFRHALEGAGLQRRTFEALRDYAEQWRASHPAEQGAA